MSPRKSLGKMQILGRTASLPLLLEDKTRFLLSDSSIEISIRPSMQDVYSLTCGCDLF